MRKNKQILVFALLFSFLCFPVKQAFAAAGMTEVPLTVKQSFVVENPVKEMDFTGNYEFRALDQEAPMPENTKNGIYSFSLNGEQVETTFSLQYLHAGVYHYQLDRQLQRKKVSNIIKAVIITAYVKNGENGIDSSGSGEKGEMEKSVEIWNFLIPIRERSQELSGPVYPSKPNKLVKTGDTTHIMAYVGIAAGSLFLILALVYFRKHKQKK